MDDGKRSSATSQPTTMLADLSTWRRARARAFSTNGYAVNRAGERVSPRGTPTSHVARGGEGSPGRAQPTSRRTTARRRSAHRHPSRPKPERRLRPPSPSRQRRLQRRLGPHLDREHARHPRALFDEGLRSDAHAPSATRKMSRTRCLPQSPTSLDSVDRHAPRQSSRAASAHSERHFRAI